MPASLIDNHLSFQPAAEILAARDKDMPTPPGAGHALAAIAEAKAQLRTIKPRNLAPFMAQAWGLSPRGARRSVLIAAGMDADRWESPIGVTSETLRRWLKEGKIPAADIAISRRTVGWRLSTLHAAGIKLL